MKLTKSTIAATFAALLIGGLSINPASAAVRNTISHIDINEHILNLELKRDFGLRDTSYSAGHVAPNGSAQAVLKNR